MLWCVSVAPLGKPVVPEVYWMLMASSNERPFAGLQVGERHLVALLVQAVPIVVEHQRPLQLGAAATHLVQHRSVRGLAEAAGQEQAADAGLIEDVFQLVGLVGGIDVDQDGADARRGVLDDDPLVAVGGPDADAVARLHAEGQQVRGPFA